MQIFKTLFETVRRASAIGTSANSVDVDPYDVWAFTDPDARDRFARDGRLEALEHDIQFEVMRGGPWQPDEMEYRREIGRLLQHGVVTAKGTYWFTSPFPTVYRALQAGSLTVGGRAYRFRAGDDIVFQCRMARDMSPELTGPLLIARLRPTRRLQLCGHMESAMKGHSGSMRHSA